MTGKYNKILSLPHHTSYRHPPMTMINRAAQFSPFAALTGYEAAVAETARLTDAKIELTEESRAELDRKQQKLLERTQEHPEVTVTFFVQDARKHGGSYKTITAPFKGIDGTARMMRLTDGRQIPLDDILDLQGKIFE